jgi:hypothetical protein
MELVKLVNRLQTQHALDERQSRQAMCLAALNLNSFIYVN